MLIFEARHRDIAMWMRPWSREVRHQPGIRIRLWVGDVRTRVAGEQVTGILLGTTLSVRIRFGFGFLDVPLALQFRNELLHDVDLEVMKNS